jgi:hypothetical protein
MDRVLSWLKKPYSDDMDVIHWVLFIGLITIIGMAWASMIRLIGD